MRHDESFSMQLHAYVDDELDSAGRLVFEAHLQHCPHCQQTIDEVRALKAAIARVGETEVAPPALEMRIRDRLNRLRRRQRLTAIWGGAAGGVLAAAALAAAIFIIPPQTIKAIVSDHRQFIADGQINEISAIQADALRGWLRPRVEALPPVLARADNCTVVGARVRKVGKRKVSTLTYHCGAHVVDFYAMADATRNLGSAPVMPHVVRGQDIHVVAWKRGRLECYAVSDLPEGGLVDLAHYIQGHAAEG